MTSYVGSHLVNLEFLPPNNISEVKDRVDVRKLYREQIEEIMKTADVNKQQLIMHDLLVAGRNMKTFEERAWTALAAELFIKSPSETQNDFLFSVFQTPAIFKNFRSALITNSVSNEWLYSKGENTGLTVEELKREKFWAIKLGRFELKI